MLQYRSRRIAVLVGALMTSLALTACGSGDTTGEIGAEGSDSSSLTTVSFGVGDPQLQVGTAPYTSVPEVMGYWEDNGLDVDVQGTAGAVASVQGLSTGIFDIVNGGSSAFYDAAATDPNLRVISLGAENVWKIAVPPDSPITDIEDLRGKTIGAQSQSSSSYLFGRAALASSGLDPDADVEWLVVGVGAQAAQALQSGDIDAYASYDGPLGVVGSLSGAPLRALDSPLDELTGTLGLATTATYLEENRETVLAFLRAYNEGKIFADENPAAAIQIHWQQYPAQAPKDVPIEQAVEETLPIVTDRWAADAAPGSEGLVGYLDPAALKDSADFFFEHGLIENPIDLEQISAMDAAKEAATSFDEEAAIADAEEWQPAS